MQVTVTARQLRGYWLTDLGQRVEGWVPPGEYDVGGPAEVHGVLTAALVNGRGFAWHIPGGMLEGLDRTDTTQVAHYPERPR